MDTATTIEVYNAMLEIYKSYMVRNTIMAGLLGVALGMSLCLIIGLCSFARDCKKLEKKEKKS